MNISTAVFSVATRSPLIIIASEYLKLGFEDFIANVMTKGETGKEMFEYDR